MITNAEAPTAEILQDLTRKMKTAFDNGLYREFGRLADERFRCLESLPKDPLSRAEIGPILKEVLAQDQLWLDFGIAKRESLRSEIEKVRGRSRVLQHLSSAYESKAPTARFIQHKG